MANSELPLLTHQSDQISILTTPTMGYTGLSEVLGLVIDDAEPATFVDLDVVSLSFAGSKDLTFFDDFYFRIHVIPNSLDLGNILSVQTENIVLWNAYLSEKVIDDYLAPVVQGVSIQAPVNTPYTMNALEEVTYTVTVAASGPPQFQDTIKWTIDGVEYLVSISGRRVVVWPFKPNWRQPVRESLEWRTDIIPSFDDTEQRLSIRSQPRMGLAYEILLEEANSQLFANLLFGWQNRQYAVPVWQDGQGLSTAIAANTTSIPVQTSGRAFVPGGLALLMSDTMNYEVVQIDAVNALSLQILKPTERAWERNDQVYPLFQAILPTNVPAQKLTSKVTRANVQFLAVPNDFVDAAPVVPADVTVDGAELLLRKPNWSTPVTVDHTYDFSTLDFQIGAFQQIQRPNYPKTRQRMSWLLESRDALTSFRSLLRRLKGRYQPALVPTWQHDMEVVEPIALNAAAIRIRSSAYSAMVGVAATRKMLMIRLTDGTYYVRSIVGASESDNDTEVISLGASIPVAVPLKNIMMVTIVHLARQSVDKIEIAHQVKGVATVEMQFEVVNQ